jgi:Fe-S-cluster containining protein
LAQTIHEKLIEVSDVFGGFQQSVGLSCPTDCSKCCFKSDIYCSPYELLPMAFYLIDTGRAEEVLEKARLHKKSNCLFLDVSDEARGTGRCSEYLYRPFICRAFGLSARYGKYKEFERSICKTLSKMEAVEPTIQIINSEIPFIDVWKRNLESIDPCLLGGDFPIHQSMAIILERLLLREKFLLGNGLLFLDNTN